MRLMVRMQSVLLFVAVTTFAIPAAAVSFQLGHRPEIGKIDAPKTAKAGQAVKITVSAKKDGNSGCGLVLNFGDGSDRQFKINRDDGKLPVSVEHVYQKNGTYTVRASGLEITTNKECKGSATAVIQVGEPKKAGKGATTKK